MQSKPLQFFFDAMHHGKYEFDNFLHADITSKYTPIRVRQRTIYCPDRTLKAYQVFLNTFLFEHLDVNDRVVYSYRKGVNPHEMALAHAKGRAFFQTDIESFFDSIDRHLARSTILRQKDNAPISDLDLHLDRIIELTIINDALPIGFPTSPLISNICLTRFDDDFEEYCLSHSLIYTRYADDIVVSGKSHGALSDVGEKLNELLAQHFSGKLRQNRRKTKLKTIGEKIKVLGMAILPNGRVTIDMELKKKIEVHLYFYICNRQKFLDISDGNIDAGIQKLSGYINYINSADKLYLEKLRRKFGATILDSFLHRSAQ